MTGDIEAKPGAEEELPSLRDLIELALEVELGETPGVSFVAAKLGMSRAGVYKLYETEILTPSRALQIIEIGRGRVTLDHFHRFVYRR